MVVHSGEQVSRFFALDLQNQYYKYHMTAEAKSIIGKLQYSQDAAFQSESRKFWKEHTGHSIHTIWHDYYSSVNGIRDVRYVPENFFYAYIEPFYNRKDFAPCCDDKCYYSERFPASALPAGASRPKTILRNISGMFFTEDFQILRPAEAAARLSSCRDGYVVKESITGSGGNRIVFVGAGEQRSEDEIFSIFQRYKKDFVVESLIQQCDELAAFNPSSVNTIRLITFMDNAGVHILSGCLRIGSENAKTDNFSTGGIACGILEDGTLKDYAFDGKYHKYSVHPNGRPFAGRRIPNYEAVKGLACALHRRFGHFRIISWDIAVSPSYAPVLIEFNLTPQSIDLHQINNGPLFGPLTEQVLKEVFGV